MASVPPPSSAPHDSLLLHLRLGQFAAQQYRRTEVCRIGVLLPFNPIPTQQFLFPFPNYTMSIGDMPDSNF